MTTFQINSTRHNTNDSVAELRALRPVIVIAWFGGMKFTNYEAQGSYPLVSESPLMSWLRHLLGTARRVRSRRSGLDRRQAVVAKVSIHGSAFAVQLFAATLRFLLTTRGVFDESVGGFPCCP